MSLKLQAVKNVTATWMGLAIHAEVGFFLSPFILHRLGDFLVPAHGMPLLNSRSPNKEMVRGRLLRFRREKTLELARRCMFGSERILQSFDNSETYAGLPVDSL